MTDPNLSIIRDTHEYYSTGLICLSQAMQKEAGCPLFIVLELIAAGSKKGIKKYRCR